MTRFGQSDELQNEAVPVSRARRLDLRANPWKARAASHARLGTHSDPRARRRPRLGDERVARSEAWPPFGRAQARARQQGRRGCRRGGIAPVQVATTVLNRCRTQDERHLVAILQSRLEERWRRFPRCARFQYLGKSMPGWNGAVDCEVLDFAIQW